MGYGKYPLTSYPEIRNWSYDVKLITPPPRLILRFIQVASAGVIEAVVDCLGQPMVGDLENDWQGVDEHVGQIF